MKTALLKTSWLIICLTLTFTLCSSEKDRLSAKKKQLVDHVITSINNTELGISKLPAEILDLHGFSSHNVRRLLNQLCTLKGAHYLEIGCWKGSTLVSALYQNEHTLGSAIAMDNWSEFGGPKREFLENIHNYLSCNTLQFYEGDCFSVDKKTLFKAPINIYFYDGNHSTEDQKRAFTYFDSILDDVFIALIDDWNAESVQTGTKEAFEELGYKVVLQIPLLSAAQFTAAGWWNGLYVAVIEKTQ